MDEKPNHFTRRQAARIIGTAAAATFLRVPITGAKEAAPMFSRPIASTGEKIPVIGLGTWQTFDIGTAPNERHALEEVLMRFVELGGKVIDSSPMYGRAEGVVGDLTARLRLRDSLFLATKVWTRGKQAGMESMERSLGRLQTRQIDLMQVHNLVDAGTHLATMREWKTQGRIRYLGVTHYNSSAYAQVEKVLRSEKLDFLQINYSIMEREAEERILPLVQERGVAVIANRPFGGGDLFRRVRARPLPEWAAEFDCESWAQFFLKWIIANPVITCAIPATNNVRHLEDNLQSGAGRLPDMKTRQRMVDLVSAL